MIRSLSQFHEQPRLLVLAESAPGQTVIWLMALILLRLHEVTLLMPLAIAAVMLQPARRRLILSIAAVAVVAEHYLSRQRLSIADLVSAPTGVDVSAWLRFGVLLTGSILLMYGIFLIARRAHAWPLLLRSQPVLALHVVLLLGLAVGGLWPLFAIFGELVPWLIWRLSYMVKFFAQNNGRGQKFSDHLFYLWPVFGGSRTPYGKGLDYLGRYEAKDRASIARAQLAGLKLLMLALAWSWLLQLFDALVYGSAETTLVQGLERWSLGWSRLGGMIGAETGPGLLEAWLGIYLELFRSVLYLAAGGHVVVGCLRLVGFNVFRNTYKPLLADSVLEFWNRYYYYFKELLVEFFFYPTYLRTSWAAPRLRLFLAVFAAAGFGNMYYHVLGGPQLIMSGDLVGLWHAWNSRLIYCLLLATGIWVSMLRQQSRRTSGASIGRLIRCRRIGAVWTFYALIHVWNVQAAGADPAARFNFYLRLAGF
jgi:hypothetical protein